MEEHDGPCNSTHLATVLTSPTSLVSGICSPAKADANSKVAFSLLLPQSVQDQKNQTHLHLWAHSIDFPIECPTYQPFSSSPVLAWSRQIGFIKLATPFSGYCDVSLPD
ncbi:unnamed protein product [Dovyalis caffra]|uniref:Uncharacterized protein n=1 Tax=Dovyalis caffra TaxID=77055 RepID=A0AAV1RY88_9ROSI|nr:unnamed protein product [Dovyalis caffra]